MGKNRYNNLVYSRPFLKERIRLKSCHHGKQNTFFSTRKDNSTYNKALFFFFFHKLNYFLATFHREAVKDISMMGKGGTTTGAALEKDIDFNKAKRHTDKRVTRQGGWESSSKYLSNITKKQSYSMKSMLSIRAFFAQSPLLSGRDPLGREENLFSSVRL